MISHTCPQSQTRNGDETPSDRRTAAVLSVGDRRQYGIVEEELKMRVHTMYTVFQ